MTLSTNVFDMPEFTALILKSFNHESKSLLADAFRKTNEFIKTKKNINLNIFLIITLVLY